MIVSQYEVGIVSGIEALFTFFYIPFLASIPADGNYPLDVRRAWAAISLQYRKKSKIN